MFHCREYGGSKWYGDEPSLTRISAHDATLELLRETLNRERQGALMRRLGGRLTAAVFELLGLLDGIPCFRLVPGKIEATADLLARTFRELQPGT